jgi:oligoribonuclease (3'-5' exoribonuclease)
MLITSFDLETTGLDPRKNNIIEIAAIVFDHEDIETPVEQLPTYHTAVKHENYCGSAFALAMNGGLLKRLAGGEGRDLYTALTLLRNFIEGSGNSRPHALGYNVASFDIQFLKANQCDLFHHRSIELGSLLSKDGLPVNSKDVAKKLFDREVTHNALQDARDAIEAYRVWKRGEW